MRLQMIVNQKEQNEEKRKYPYFGKDQESLDIVLFLGKNRGLFFGSESDLSDMSHGISLSIDEDDFNVVKGTITFEQS